MADTAFITGASGFVGGALTRSLIADGWSVRALARSDAAAAKVEALGAEAVRGDLDSANEIRQGAEGCGLAFHCAALAAEWGRAEEFERANIAGTANALSGCAAAGVGRFVHVGTEAAHFDMQPLVRIRESEPLRADSRVLYSRTKARAEQLVREANRAEFETVVVRPRLVWGAGDTSVMPGMIAAVEAGQWAWVAGGRHLTDTTHIDNAVHGLRLAAEKGRPGSAYFVTDGEPTEFRRFVTDLLGTQGVELPGRSIPAWLARGLANAGETLWTRFPLPGEPPMTRLAAFLASFETTLDTSLAEQELGYAPVTTREAGLQAMAAAAA